MARTTIIVGTVDSMRPIPGSAAGPTGVAVLAGCGDLGIRVARLLTLSGYRVLGLRRRPDLLPAWIEGQAVDLTRDTPQLPPETTVVIAALTADTRTADGYRETNFTSLGHILEAIDRLPAPPRMLWVSSTAVYGENAGGWVDETSPTAPNTPTGGVLRQTEQLLHDRSLDGIVLRLSGLYGSTPSTLIDSVRRGAATIPEGPLYTNRIHRDDAAAAIVHLATAVAQPSNLYLGTDDEPVDRGTLLRFIADELSTGQPPKGDDHRVSGQGKRCRNRHLRDTGFELSYPTYRHGYHTLIHDGETDR